VLLKRMDIDRYMYYIPLTNKWYVGDDPTVYTSFYGSNDGSAGLIGGAPTGSLCPTHLDGWKVYNPSSGTTDSVGLTWSCPEAPPPSPPPCPPVSNAYDDICPTCPGDAPWEVKLISGVGSTTIQNYKWKVLQPNPYGDGNTGRVVLSRESTSPMYISWYALQNRWEVGPNKFEFGGYGRIDDFTLQDDLSICGDATNMCPINYKHIQTFTGGAMQAGTYSFECEKPYDQKCCKEWQGSGATNSYRAAGLNAEWELVPLADLPGLNWANTEGRPVFKAKGTNYYMYYSSDTYWNVGDWANGYADNAYFCWSSAPASDHSCPDTVPAWSSQCAGLTLSCTVASTSAPTTTPTAAPTSVPTLGSTLAPTVAPTTMAPTAVPTGVPSVGSTMAPTVVPTTMAPTAVPTSSGGGACATHGSNPCAGATCSDAQDLPCSWLKRIGCECGTCCASSGSLNSNPPNVCGSDTKWDDGTGKCQVDCNGA